MPCSNCSVHCKNEQPFWICLNAQIMSPQPLSAGFPRFLAMTSSRRNAHGWTHKYAILVCIMQLVAPIVERITLVDDKNLNQWAKANIGWVTSPIISPGCYGLSIKRCLKAEISNRWSLSLVSGSGSTGPINLILLQAPRNQSNRSQSDCLLPNQPNG